VIKPDFDSLKKDSSGSLVDGLVFNPKSKTNILKNSYKNSYHEHVKPGIPGIKFKIYFFYHKLFIVLNKKVLLGNLVPMG